jgi:hypothetical protein
MEQVNSKCSKLRRVGELSSTSSGLVGFARARREAGGFKHFGREMMLKDIASVSAASNVDDVELSGAQP